MMIRIILMLSLCCCFISADCQVKRDISKRNACGAFGPVEEKSVYEWETDPDDKARLYVEMICKEEVIVPNFKIMRASISNAMSTTDSLNERYIYYSMNFFQNNNNKWGLIAVLAHEIGHQINNDALSKDNNHRQEDELHADEFAGKVLCRLHGSLKDAKLLMDQNCSTQESALYPSKKARIEAISNGYDHAGCHLEEMETAATPSLNALSESEINEGWFLLFDGRSTNGWHTYGKSYNDGSWDIQDGTLHAAGGLNITDGSGDLITNEIVGDFDLKMEWKISPGGNSGVMFYVQENAGKPPFASGPEMQILDDIGNPHGKIDRHRAGDLYDLIAANKNIVKPPGEWNQIEIYCKQGNLKLYQNGAAILSTTLWDDNWRSLIANNPFFNKYQDFGTYRYGKIDLQKHGQEVWFRNIKLKKL
jgi:hypothetical protein